MTRPHPAASPPATPARTPRLGSTDVAPSAGFAGFAGVTSGGAVLGALSRVLERGGGGAQPLRPLQPLRHLDRWRATRWN